MNKRLYSLLTVLLLFCVSSAFAEKQDNRKASEMYR